MSHANTALALTETNVEDAVVDDARLSLLFARYALALKRMLRRHGGTPSANAREARTDRDLDDLVQDAFLSVLARSRSVPELRVTPAYLFTVARNQCIDRWRRREHAPVEVHGSDDAGSMPLDQLETERAERERAEVVARYVERLPAGLAKVYEARFVRGLSQRVAATYLGISRGQLRTLERSLFSGALRELTPQGKPSDRELATAGSPVSRTSQ